VMLNAMRFVEHQLAVHYDMIFQLLHLSISTVLPVVVYIYIYNIGVRYD